jgi:hypothetical protein
MILQAKTRPSAIRRRPTLCRPDLRLRVQSEPAALVARHWSGVPAEPHRRPPARSASRGHGGRGRRRLGGRAPAGFPRAGGARHHPQPALAERAGGRARHPTRPLPGLRAVPTRGTLYGYAVESELPLARLRTGPAPRGRIVLAPARGPLLEEPGAVAHRPANQKTASIEAKGSLRNILNPSGGTRRWRAVHHTHNSHGEPGHHRSGDSPSS